MRRILCCMQLCCRNSIAFYAVYTSANESSGDFMLHTPVLLKLCPILRPLYSFYWKWVSFCTYIILSLKMLWRLSFIHSCYLKCGVFSVVCTSIWEIYSYYACKHLLFSVDFLYKSKRIWVTTYIGNRYRLIKSIKKSQCRIILSIMTPVCIYLRRVWFYFDLHKKYVRIVERTGNSTSNTCFCSWNLRLLFKINIFKI
jgi:hypothetical protein